MGPQDVDRPQSIGFIDEFKDNRPPGTVVGQTSDNGVVRKGNDVERVISADNGALRIAPLAKPGWGRAGLAYGPYKRTQGLTFAALVLNGHNTSQMDGLSQSLVRRLGRWVKGSGTETPIRRMLRWLIRGDKRQMWRQLQRWVWLSRHGPSGDNALDENMALGWFRHSVPANPLHDGNALVMHAAGPDNGELWANASSQQLQLVRGVQNIPIYYVVALRSQGAAYYSASISGSRGLSELPRMRPLAIDVLQDDVEVYAGIYQSVLGQIGFRVDTRVYAAQVALLEEFREWFGTAHAADRLCGNGTLHGTQAEVGGAWTVLRGNFQRTPEGTRSDNHESLAVLDPGSTSGLLHLLIQSKAGEATASVVWRFKNEDNCWCLSLSHSMCRLSLIFEGRWYELDTADGEFLLPGKAHAIQINDDGTSIAVYQDGRLLFNQPVADSRLADATGVGLRTQEPSHGLTISDFEAHPRTVAVPEELKVPALWQERGNVVTIRDDFAGPAGPLAGRKTSTGEIWQRDIGQGELDASGDGHVQVRASVHHPNPGRTGYMVPWSAPEFAEAAVRIRPPGTGRGQGENGRAGLIFWQDPDNYIVINNWLDDYYKGASISSFFRLNGLEELYDAVWTNVGSRILWGRSHELRVVFDGIRYLVFVDNEPVLYRALSDVYPRIARLAINRLGIVANWEWGNDTGSTFTDFVALRNEAQQ